LRIPGSYRSKYDTKVKIVKNWNGVRSPVTIGFLEEFRTWLIQKKIDQQKQRQKIRVERSKNKFVGSSNYYTGIEHLTQTPIEDFRKLVIDIILAPYLINVRKLSFEESYTIIRNWLDKCNELRLDNYRNFEYRINYALKNALNKGIGPMSMEKIKTDSTYSDYINYYKKRRFFDFFLYSFYFIKKIEYIEGESVSQEDIAKVEVELIAELEDLISIYF